MAARKEQGAALGGGRLEGSVPDPDLDVNRVEVMGCRGQTREPWDAVAGRGGIGRGLSVSCSEYKVEEEQILGER